MNQSFGSDGGRTNGRRTLDRPSVHQNDPMQSSLILPRRMSNDEQGQMQHLSFCRTIYFDICLSLESVGRTNIRLSNIRPTVHKQGQMQYLSYRRTIYLDIRLSLEPVGRTNIRLTNIRPTFHKKRQMQYLSYRRTIYLKYYLSLEPIDEKKRDLLKKQRENRYLLRFGSEDYSLTPNSTTVGRRRGTSDHAVECFEIRHCLQPNVNGNKIEL